MSQTISDSELPNKLAASTVGSKSEKIKEGVESIDRESIEEKESEFARIEICKSVFSNEEALKYNLSSAGELGDYSSLCTPLDGRASIGVRKRDSRTVGQSSCTGPNSLNKDKPESGFAKIAFKIHFLSQ